MPLPKDPIKAEETRQKMSVAKKGEKHPLFGKKNPLWRQFEDASPQEREGMVEWCEVWESSDGKDIAVRFNPPKDVDPNVRYMRSYGLELLTPLMLKTVKSEKHVIHTKNWIDLRNSFTNCKEWDQFRLQWIQTHPTCVRCGRTYDEGLQVHHAVHFNQSSVVMEEGFLEGLKHPERFETLCSGCHSNLHWAGISLESVLKGKNAEILAQKPLKSNREVKEKEKMLLLSLVNPCCKLG